MLHQIRNPFYVLVQDVIKLTANATEQQIQSAIFLFRNQIQSNRVIGYITDFRGLIAILEVRSVLHFQNVEPLELIAKIADCKLALDLIEKYKTYQEPVGPISPKISTHLTISELPKKTKIKNAVIEVKEDAVLEKVFAKVTKMVTPNEVRDFARYLPLGLYESDIANLMRQCRNEQATLKILELLRRVPDIDHIETVREVFSFKKLRRLDIQREIDAILNNP